MAESKQKLVVKRRKKGAPNKKRKNYLKGLNLQKLCEQKFPYMRGIKICQLIYQCEEQSWRSLSVHQQKRYYMVPDSLKVALGKQQQVRGWKSLSKDEFTEAVEKNSTVNRWSVPAAVLKDEVRLESLFFCIRRCFCIRHSL